MILYNILTVNLFLTILETGRAIGLRPADAAALAADGSDAFDVLRWWDAGVPRDEAASWLVAGFAPDEAARARADGATAERAAVLRALGGGIGPASASPGTPGSPGCSRAGRRGG